MSIATSQTVMRLDTGARAGVAVRAPRNKTRATVLWVCVMLIAAEGTLRLRAWYRHGSNSPVAGIYEADGLLGRRPRPGAVLRGRQRNLNINRWGFRGREIAKEKPAGTTRIAAIGDSTTFGMEASSDDKVWVARMVELLSKSSGGRSPERVKDRSHATGVTYDAINAGVPGYSLATCAVQLRERVIPFDPDIVIVYAMAGDLLGHTKRQFPPAAAQAAARSGLTAFAYEHSLLLNLIRLNTTAFRSKQIPEQRHDRLDERGVIQYVERLERIADICRQHDLELVLCTCPRAFGDETAPTDQYTLAQTAMAHNSSLSLAGLNDAFTRYNDAIRRTAHKHGVILVDLDALVPKRRAYFADAVHFNDAGHELAAEAMARAISKNRGPGTLAQRRP